MSAPLLPPRLRGVSHQWGVLVAAVAGGTLVAFAPDERARIALGVYALSLCAMLGASALYHRVDWSPRGAAFARRLDHSMIFVMVAGTYTPFTLLVMTGDLAHIVLVTAWVGALLGVAFTIGWTHAPTWLRAGLYTLLGWASVLVAPQVLDHRGPVALALLILGGVLYTAGAVVYVRQRPDPIPQVFGFHEVFHVFVLLAAAVHFVAIAIYAT